MSRNMKGVHIGFLRQITLQMAVRQESGTWSQVEAEKVLEKAENQSLETYIYRR